MKTNPSKIDQATAYIKKEEARHKAASAERIANVILKLREIDSDFARNINSNIK